MNVYEYFKVTIFLDWFEKGLEKQRNIVVISFCCKYHRFVISQDIVNYLLLFVVGQKLYKNELKDGG